METSDRIPAWRSLQVADSPADVEWEPVMMPVLTPTSWADTSLQLGAFDEPVTTEVRSSKKYNLMLRNDTNNLLGVVKSNYHPLFNHQVQRVCDYLVNVHGFTFEAVVEFEGGATLFYTLSWPLGSWAVSGDKSNWLPFINLVNNHSGARQFMLMPSAMRPLCANVIRAWSTRARNAGMLVSRRHTSQINDMERLIVEVDYLVHDGKDAIQELQEVTTALSVAKPIAVEDFIDKWLPMPEKPGEEADAEKLRSWRRRCNHVQNRRSKFNRVLHGQTAAGEPDNAYAIWQAAIECDQHFFTARGRESRAYRNITGGTHYSESALRIVRELVS